MHDFQPIFIILLVFAIISMTKHGRLRRRQTYMQDEIDRLRAERAIAAPAPAPTTDQVRRLEERVRVLERIVTDRSQDLASEIEELRGQSAAREQEQ